MPSKQINFSARSARYLTTAIPYVNASPHIGFVLELVQADTLARHYRQKGDQVRFQAGTDENSLKNVQAADAAGIPTAELVSRNAAKFVQLKSKLNLSYDDFIRTSADARHSRGVENLWARCFSSGDIYKRPYSGLYCTGCEQFYKPEDLDDGKCQEHGVEPSLVEEENWFFRLSRYKEGLRELYKSNTINIIPQSRKNEVLSWIDSGLDDFSISRSVIRARNWGIPVPGDPSQVIYVWFDALGSYLSALGFGSETSSEFEKWWPRAIAREHVIGKGITRFHAIYWPAILLSAGIAPPTRLFVHGYVTAEGRKIGKSTGNAVDPIPLIDELGSDAVRYYLLRHIRATGDGDFSHERFARSYDSELAGQLGNLVHRVLSMTKLYLESEDRNFSEFISILDGETSQADEFCKKIAEHLDCYAFDQALDAVWSYVASCNRYVHEEEPWNLAKLSHANTETESSRIKLNSVLATLLLRIFTIAKCIAPMLPGVSQKIFRKLGAADENDDTWRISGVEVGPPLFPKRI